MALLRVTVCELPSSPTDFERDWQGLVEHVLAEQSELVLLPELVFAPWFAATSTFEPTRWQAAVSAHQFWGQRFGELGGAAVLGSRPVNCSGRRHNHGFVADSGGIRDVHTKSYVPDEEGFWEGSWYQAGSGPFELSTVSTPVASTAVGFLICTEMWFMHQARAYGQAGAQLIATPRCTPSETLDKWLAGGRACATVAGAYSLSSNHADPQFGGQGWVVDPDGEVLAVTSPSQPWVSVEIDLDHADAIKATYPRYVRDL